VNVSPTNAIAARCRAGRQALVAASGAARAARRPRARAGERRPRAASSRAGAHAVVWVIE
jgi:hypothetical protein